MTSNLGSVSADEALVPFSPAPARSGVAPSSERSSPGEWSDTAPAPGQGAAADCAHAVELLFELAGALRHVSRGPRARALHLRALALKPILERWSLDPPGEADRQAMIDELLALQVEVRQVRAQQARLAGPSLRS